MRGRKFSQAGNSSLAVLWICDKIRFEVARDLRRKTITAEVIPSTLADMEAEWQRYLKGLKLELRQKLAPKAAAKGG